MATRMITLKNENGPFSAYYSPPQVARKGGLVVIHELFGLTDAVKELADTFGARGYDVLAPNLFDRFEPNYAYLHGEEGLIRGRVALEATSWEQMVLDVQSCADALKKWGPAVYMCGFCFGGSVTWVSAARATGLTATSAFYGRAIAREFADLTPQTPTMLHYGDRDAYIPMAEIELMRARHPDLPLHLY